MSSLSSFEGSLQLFASGFAARDIASPLPSFDDTSQPDMIPAAMAAQNLEVAGIRRMGSLVGWLHTSDLSAGQPLVWKPFDAATLLSDAAPLNEVVQRLDASPWLFVRTFGQASGLITRQDLQKPAMRMWLFGLVTITELRVTAMIDELCPNESWQQHLSEGRLQKANELREQRRQRGQQRTLLDCLQFADKGTIVARVPQLREQSRFSSKREVEDFVNALQDLRNNLAHAQDITSDWEVIRNLATNLHRIVRGPESQL
jgi:hypothetical protein